MIVTKYLNFIYIFYFIAFYISYFRNGSDWVLKEIRNIDLSVATHDATRAGSFLQLPKKIKESKTVLNIQNNDNLCALWCIIAHLFPKYRTDGRRQIIPDVYEEHRNQIDTGDLQFPLRIRDIGKLERLNNISVNVYSLDHKAHVIPIRISNEKEVPEERIIDLLYVEHELNTHYCLITNIAGMLFFNLFHRLASHIARLCERRPIITNFLLFNRR